ncbi:MAG TPA: hypothetical protein VF698_03285 [Thermoanaerobaculia bacterium]|jgi:hypothetical protein
MSDIECIREHDLLEAIRDGRWPAAGELREHVASCASCEELARVASAIFNDSVTLTSVAAVPAPGVVYWRGKRRVRAEAIRTASRTMAAVQAISILAAVAIGVAILGTMSISATDLVTSFRNALPSLASIEPSLPLLLAFAALAALAPVAVWLAAARD